MRPNNKGFTLIELLAVIVILAIIAVITAPIMLNVIEDARVDASKDKAWGFVDAIRLAYTQDQAKNADYQLGTDKTVSDKGKIDLGSNVEIKASGERPSAGKFRINKDGSIVVAGLKFGKYYCATQDATNKTKIDANNMVCSKTQSDVLATLPAQDINDN